MKRNPPVAVALRAACCAVSVTVSDTPLSAANRGTSAVSGVSAGYVSRIVWPRRRAMTIRGTRFLHVLSPCPPGWKFSDERTVELGRMAVASRVFPLKANMARLTQFCDQYVNMDIPQDVVHFRPAVPYVYLMVLDYGSMSPASVQAQNVGWVAQHEVGFAVPLERWREEGGKLVFKGKGDAPTAVDGELTMRGAVRPYGTRDAETALHPSCTAKMGTGPDAVTDPLTMRVHGLAGLRTTRIQQYRQ